MSIEEKLLKVNKYFDGELNREEEVLLFTELSADEELRDYFKQLHILKEGAAQIMEEVPESLDAKILHAAAEKADQNTPRGISFSFPQIISYSVALVMIVLSVLFYSQSRNYEQKFEATVQQVNQQNKMIELLFNSLPQAEVQAEPENNVIVKANL